MQTLTAVSAPLSINDSSWARAIRYYRYLIWPSMTYVIVCFFILATNRPELISTIPLGILKFLLGSLVMMSAAASIYTIKFLAKTRPPNPISVMYKEFRSNHLRNENIPFIVIPWLTLSVVVLFFLKMKILIPTVNPYYLDVAAHDWDKWLHFGKHPWEWLAPVTNIPEVTKILHRNYYVWFPVIYVTFAWQAFTLKDPKLKLQFIMAFVGCWAIIGTGFATLLASVGPIFYDRLPDGNSTSYGAAVAYLEGIHYKDPLTTIEVRDKLWNAYLGIAESEFIRGISAMPSMHVAMSFVLVLLGWRKGVFSGIAYTLFGLAIAVGSVSLLWHYALDGYISIVLVLGIWWVCGKLAQKTIDAEEALARE